MSHHSYKQGDSFNINGYTVKINNSYYSDKSYNGTQVSNKSGFVIIDISITNNATSSRKVDLNKYHVINGINNYTPTEKTYETEFKDLGKSYDSVTLKSEEKKEFLLIFKVDKKLSKNRFVLYYQELNGNTEYLRKIKLKINDLSKINTKANLKLGQTLELVINGEEENINFEDYKILDAFTYEYKICKTSDCDKTDSTYIAPAGYKALVITFSSDTYEGNDLSEFSKDYGKIVYKNSKGKEVKENIKNALNRGYYGKFLYFTIPEEAAQSDYINLEFTVRNNKYIYKIK